MDEKQLIEYLQPIIEPFGDHPYLKALVVLLIAIVLANLIAVIITKLVKVITLRTNNQLDDKVVILLHRPLVWTVILVGFLLALSLLNVADNVSTIIHSIVATILILLWSGFVIRLTRTLLHTMSARAKPQAAAPRRCAPTKRCPRCRRARRF